MWMVVGMVDVVGSVGTSLSCRLELGGAVA